MPWLQGARRRSRLLCSFLKVHLHRDYAGTHFHTDPAPFLKGVTCMSRSFSLCTQNLCISTLKTVIEIKRSHHKALLGKGFFWQVNELLLVELVCSSLCLKWLQTHFLSTIAFLLILEFCALHVFLVLETDCLWHVRTHNPSRQLNMRINSSPLNGTGIYELKPKLNVSSKINLLLK